MASMFGFGKASKHEEGKVEKKKDDKGGKRIFGVPLEVLTLVEAKCFENDVLHVPVVVRDSIEWLRQHNGVVEEGIFRVPGNQAEIDALKKQYDTVGQAKLESHYEAHTIAGLLKLWFRELPEPVLIFRYYETFIRVGKNQDPTARKANLRMLLTGLPEANRSLILYLMDFLKEVASHSEKNKMGTDNVAMVFAPNILRPQGPQDQNSLLNDASAVKDILRTLIEELPYMRAGVMRSRKNLGLAPASDPNVALVSPREATLLSPREEALMLSESTKIRTTVVKDPKEEGKVAAEPKKDEAKKDDKEKKGHKHSRSIGNLMMGLVPKLDKTDASTDTPPEPQKSPNHHAAQPDPSAGGAPKSLSTKHGRSESHHGHHHQQPKAESARKDTTKEPGDRQMRRSVSIQGLDDLRSLAKQIDLAALNQLGSDASGEHSNTGSAIEHP